MSNDTDILYELAELLDGAKVYSERYIASLCPFHDDRRPSFFCYTDTYKCLSCGAFGKTEDLYNKLTHAPPKYHAPTTYYQNPWTAWTKHETLGQALATGQRYLQDHPSSYLMKRGISEKYQRLAKLGLRDDFYLFPIYNPEQKLIGAVARRGEQSTLDSKYILPAGQNPNLLYVPNWNKTLKCDVVFLVYGILDALSLAIMGYGAMSTTTGKRIAPSALDQIRKRIILIPDQGEETDAMRLSAQLGWRSHVQRVDWPDGTKDVNDVFVKYNNQDTISILGLNI